MSISEVLANVGKSEKESSLAAHLPEFRLNTKSEDVKENIRSAIRRQLPQCCPHETQEEVELVLLGGGWSLAHSAIEIHGLFAEGAKIVTMNGTHKWAIEHNLRPSAHVMLDAREFNSRFVQKPVSTCRYLISSQCHPATFDALENQDVWIWHSATDKEEMQIISDYYLRHWCPIIGGSTVMLRSLSLLRLLGFRKFHIFGFDSCCAPGTNAHHAYEQRENDKADLIRFDYKGKTWTCHTWMASQALDFIGQSKAIGQDWDLKVYGNGLIAHILREG